MLKHLPANIYLDGMTFQFQIFINGTDDYRAGYILTGGGQWANPTLDCRWCNFLVLEENIRTDEQMRHALDGIYKHLRQNGFIHY